MLRFSKNVKVFALILLMSALFLPALNLCKAQGQDTVTVFASVGGTTDPTDGTYSYNGGSSVTFTATPDSDFEFVSWAVVSTSGANTVTDNPFTLTVSDNTYSIQATFVPIILIAPATKTSVNNAIVVVLPSVGGTVSPQPGTYAIANAAQFKLTATANDGYQFAYWVISGSDLSGHGGYPFTLTPTDNPYTVGHGYGATYDYQPVFIPVNSTVSTATPTPSPTSGGTIMGVSAETIIIIALAGVLVIVLIGFGGYVYKHRSKK